MANPQRFAIKFFILAKWEYSIPLVHRFQIFEMPLLGYAGYLPFGLECTVIGDMLGTLLKKGSALGSSGFKVNGF